MKIADDAIVGDLVNPSLRGLSSRFPEDREKVSKEEGVALRFLVRQNLGLPG